MAARLTPAQDDEYGYHAYTLSLAGAHARQIAETLTRRRRAIAMDAARNAARDQGAEAPEDVDALAQSLYIEPPAFSEKAVDRLLARERKRRARQRELEGHYDFQTFIDEQREIMRASHRHASACQAGDSAAASHLGNARRASEAVARALGIFKDHHVVTGPNGGAIKHEHAHDFSGYSDAELEQIIARGG